MNKLKLNRKGFTIVELLIVIVIIGILATIGFVAFSGAQNKARKSKAESTLSQVKSKLGEYYTVHNTYPANKGAVEAYLLTPDGGNNTALEDTFDEAGYTYECGSTADSTDCATGFRITANASIWNNSPAGNITVTN